MPPHGTENVGISIDGSQRATGEISRCISFYGVSEGKAITAVEARRLGAKLIEAADELYQLDGPHASTALPAAFAAGSEATRRAANPNWCHIGTSSTFGPSLRWRADCLLPLPPHRPDVATQLRSSN